jgi:SAM-dependent methyltransferase
MVNNDYVYFCRCFAAGLVKGPLLEVGSMAIDGQGGNICAHAMNLGVSSAFGVDLAAGPGVDYVSDFSVAPEQFEWEFDRFKTVVLFNILEHTFDPITILRNAMRCVEPGGTLLLVVPTVWPLHDYPKDFCRLNPHWFEQFAEKYGLSIVPEAFCWLSDLGIVPVKSLHSGPQLELPSFLNLGKAQTFRYWRSRAAHKLFNTFGRSHWYSHCAIACAMRMPG